MPRVRGEQTEIVQSVQRVVRILESFTPYEPELGITAIRSKSGLPASTAHRLLASLEVAGLIEYTPDTQRYRLGVKLFHLGLVVAGEMKLYERARPIMREVRDRTGESVTLTVIEGAYRVTVAVEESHHDLRPFAHLGARFDLPAGAAGKVLMAYLPETALAKLLAGYRPGTGPAAPRTADALRAELRQIQEQGYAITRGERVQDLVGVSAPVRDHLGAVVASLSLSCPSPRCSPERVELFRHEIVAGAAELSRNLGHAG